jgi:hypothetical protein
LFLIYLVYFDKLHCSVGANNLFSIFYIQCFNIIPIKPLKTYNDLSNKNYLHLKKDLGFLGGVANATVLYIINPLNNILVLV